jgi:hypothetical protein
MANLNLKASTIWRQSYFQYKYYIVNLECGGYFASNIDARLIKSLLSSFNSRHLKIVESGLVDVVPNYLSENGEDVAGGLDE